MPSKTHTLISEDLRHFFKQAPNPLALLMGPEYTFVLANDPYLQLIGRDPTNRKIRDVFTEGEANDFLALLDQVFQTGNPYLGQELPFLRANARGGFDDLFINLAYHPYRDAEGKIVGILAFVYDVTEQVVGRKNAEMSKARYSRLADAMPQIVWTATPDGLLDYFNQVWFDYSGTTYEENVGSGWAKAVHPDDLSETAKKWAHALATGEVYETEFRLRNKNGAYRWHVVRALPARGPDGKIISWNGTNTDIHNVRKLTHQLEITKKNLESEQQKFKTIFADSATSMAVLQGEDFIYEIANKSYLDLFNNRELVGKPFLIALPELEGQEFPLRAKEVFESGIPYQDKEARAFLKRTADAPLEERYFDQAYTRITDENGAPYGVFIHAIEVTERVFARREIEETTERLRIAIETANMGTWELNPQTGEVLWSERSKVLFGAGDADTLMLEKAMSRIHQDDIQRVKDAITKAIDPAGTGEYEIEYRIVHDSGDIRWVSLRGKSFFADTPNGRISTKFTGNVLDVTDRVMSEVALRDAKERAETANAAKSAFLANMSHEIRTPLGAIMGFVSLIKDEGVTPKMLTDYVTVIERNSTQLMRIIDDILDLSKVEAGMMLIEHIDFSLVELLSDFASLMGFRAREKGVLFELKAKTELPNMIKSDPTRIRQVLTNIVGNAIKFTEFGSVQLLVGF
jgi:PAS domain S-box-containing protein